jgi:hypothetical protein
VTSCPIVISWVAAGHDGDIARALIWRAACQGAG